MDVWHVEVLFHGKDDVVPTDAYVAAENKAEAAKFFGMSYHNFNQFAIRGMGDTVGANLALKHPGKVVINKPFSFGRVFVPVILSNGKEKVDARI